MSENRGDFREAMVELVETTYPEPAGHPSPDQWLAYQRGELAAEEEERLAEHLVRCRDCCDLAEAAEAFAAPDEEPGAGGEVASAAHWRLLRPRLGPVREIRAAPPPRRLAAKPRLPWALAASFLVAFLGLGAWNLEQQRTLAELRTPKPDAPIVPFSGGERLSVLEEETTLAAGSGPWMLVFQPGEELQVYRLAIRDAATGREVDSYELRPNQDSALTLHLPEGRLRPGLYRLEISDGSGAGRVLEEHRLRVLEAGHGD